MSSQTTSKCGFGEIVQIVKYDDGSEYEQTYRFNVEYNKDIFIKPPVLRQGQRFGEKQSDSEWT